MGSEREELHASDIQDCEAWLSLWPADRDSPRSGSNAWVHPHPPVVADVDHLGLAFICTSIRTQLCTWTRTLTAGPLVCGVVDRDRVALPSPRGAARAGKCGTDWRAAAGPGAERGQRVPQDGFAGPGGRGQVLYVRGLRLAGGGEVVAGGSTGGEPGREACGDDADRQVAGGCGARKVRGDRLAGDRCGAERERPGWCCGACAGVMGFHFLQVPQAAVMPWLRSSRVNAE